MGTRQHSHPIQVRRHPLLRNIKRALTDGPCAPNNPTGAGCGVESVNSLAQSVKNQHAIPLERSKQVVGLQPLLQSD